MMSLLKYVAPAAFLFSISVSAKAADDGVPQNLELKCTTTAVVANQPCGGTNSRTIALLLDNGPTPYTGYKEDAAYGGCYPITTSNYGKLANFSREGDDLVFDLVPVGTFSIAGNIPIVFDTAPAEPAIPARLNLKTSVLRLDTTKVWWPYQQPSVLTCAPLY